MNFLDPQKTSDGKPYGPTRYKELVKERYIISKNTYTSYLDTGKITPTEKEILISLIAEDRKKAHDDLEKSKANRHGRR